jgi:hypothetical protein
MSEYPHERSSSSPTRSDEKNVGLETAASSILTAEEAELARLGYKQEFKREFSWISTFSFAFSISGLLATVPPLSIEVIVDCYNFWISLGRRRSSCCYVVLVYPFYRIQLT